MAIMSQILRAISDSTKRPLPPVQTVTAPNGEQMVPTEDNALNRAELGNPNVAGVMGRILSPEAGSFWWSALENGLVNARAGQQAYELGLKKAALDDVKTTEEVLTARTNRQKSEAELAKAPYITTPTGVVLDPRVTGPDGGPRTVFTPPQPTSETERILSLYQKTPDGPFKKLLERVLKNYQYEPEVIGAQTAGRVAVARARPRAAARGRAPPKPPTGAIIVED